MSDHEPHDAAPAAADDAAPDALEMETFDVDHDGEVGVVDQERARLGVVDARLEEIAEHGGITGKLADVAHHVLDKLDND